jgi:large-conductance mechanosensitive channel
MTEQQQEEYASLVQENIRELKNDKEKLTSINVTIDDFFRGYNVVPLLVGTMIGTALVYIVKNFSDDIIGPLLHTFIFNNTTYIKLGETQFNIEHIVSNCVFAILSIVVLYLFLILFLKKNIQITILNQKNDEINKQNTLLNTSRYQQSSITLLSKIKKLLEEDSIDKNKSEKYIKYLEEST